MFLGRKEGWIIQSVNARVGENLENEVYADDADECRMRIRKKPSRRVRSGRSVMVRMNRQVIREQSGKR